jgi:hypothetical protein
MLKNKVLKMSIWLSAFGSLIVLCALFIYIGFNNYRHGNSILLIIGFLLLPLIYFSAYKGFKLLLEILFDKP